MKIYLVTVRPPLPTARYFDSIWVVKEHADTRVADLRKELQRSGHDVWFSSSVLDNEWYVTVTEATALDGQLEAKPK